MELKNRIKVSFEDMVADVLRKLDDLRRFRYDSKYRSLLGDSVIKHMEDWDNNIRARLKDPLTIVVAGEFKKGKSSFINALLGEEILPTDVTTETVTMNRLNYGIHKNEAVLSGGRKMSINDDELKRESLEAIMKEIGEPIRQLELYRENEILKDIRIIDTPGTNDATAVFDDIVAEALTQADVVVYVYSVEQPLSRTEQMYLKYTVLPQKYTDLFLVGNYGDLMNTEDNFTRIKELLKKRIQQILPNERSYVISSLDELCRVRKSERPCAELTSLLESEFDALRDRLSELIETKKTSVAADRMQRMTSMMMKELSEDIANIEKGLEMTDNELNSTRENLVREKNSQLEKLNEIRAEIKTIIEKMKDEALNWLKELLCRIENEDLSKYTASDLLQFYSYYCIDLLQRGVQECLELHRELLLERMGELSEEMGKGLAGTYSTQDTSCFSMRIDSNTWTKGDSITLAISHLASGSVISAVSDLVGSLIRHKEIEYDKIQIIDNIRSKYPELRREINVNIDTQYTELNRSSDKIVEEYYRGRIERAEAAVNQYEEASRKSDTEKESVLQAIMEVRKYLNDDLNNWQKRVNSDSV